jgi:cytochrome bd-type quinol oxidase subunit 2
MWLFHRPLCGFVRVTAVNPGSQACPTLIPEFVLTGRTLALAVVLVVALIVIVRQLWRLDPTEAYDTGTQALVPLALTALIATVALIAVSTQLPDTPLFATRGIAVEPIAILILIPLAALAVVVLTARDARRFVAGVVFAIVGTFVIFYPNLAALPLPAAIANAYQGLLPTYVYPFQFPVSTVDRTGASPPLFALGPALLLAALTFTCLVVAYSAWAWRMSVADRYAAEAGSDSEGDPAVVGGGGA